MSGFEGIRRVFRLGIGGGDSEREVDRELAFHFEETVRELVSSGMTEGEARMESRRRFGDEARYRKELGRMARGADRRMRVAEGLGTVGTVVREAARGVVRAPGLALAVVVVIGLGVGVNAAMFGVLDRVFVRPPAWVRDADGVRRVFVHRRYSTGREGTDAYHTYPDYRDWSGVESLAATAAYSPQELVVTTPAGVERQPVTLATAGFFPLLGVRPSLGRFYGEAEDRLGGARVAVLSHEFWRSRFGGSADVLGEQVEVEGTGYTVVGVAPPGFTGAELKPVSVWLPFHAAGELVEGGTEWVESRGWYWFEVLARLDPSVPVHRAEAEATAALRAGRADNPGYDAEAKVELASLILARTSEASAEAKVVPWLMGVALMVLLLTCANVANLLLARASARERETAVQLALGAGQGRIIGTAMLESMLLALAGGAAAIVLAAWGGGLLRSLMLPDLAWRDAPGGARVLAFGLAVTLLAGLLSGLVPAFRLSRPHVVGSLRANGRGVVRGRSRMRSGLLVAQAAISVVLLVGTGLFVLSLRHARGVDLGFEPDRVLLVRLEPEGGYPGGEAMTRMYRDAREEVRGLAGVDATAISTTLPFRNNRGVDLRVPGLDSIPTTAAGGAYINAVTGGYFEVMGLEVLQGRGLDDADDGSAARVAVVNATMARLLWPGGGALGQCLIIEEHPCATVVGVVEDHHRYELEEPASLQYYVPLSQAPFPWPPTRLIVETAHPGALAGPVRDALQGQIPGAKLVTTQPYEDVIDPSYRSWQLGATLFAAFGVLALLVAAVGLYSVLSFNVLERRPELGIRSALGAGSARLIRLFLGDGIRVAGIGTLLGLAAGGFAATRAEPLLFRVDPLDPRVLGAVAVAVLTVAAVASVLPAWRATRVDPNEVLRSE